MRDDANDGPRGRRPTGRGAGRSRGPGRRRRPGSPRRGGPGPAGPIGLVPLDGNCFELVHPACVRQTELDYEEGLEIWRAGDPEGARDALRYTLGACRDNLWIHVALGRIALEEFRDPTLARGHFGHAAELGRRALPPRFAGVLPANRTANRPFHDALDGLIRTLDALGKPGEAAAVRAEKQRLSGAGPAPSKPPDREV